jgi:hypothetical protein
MGVFSWWRSWITQRLPPTARDSTEASATASLTGEQVELAKSITDHVFDSMERQLWRSYAIVRAGKYADLVLQN